MAEIVTEPGPWVRYASQPTADEGPWLKYASPAEARGPFIDARALADTVKDIPHYLTRAIGGAAHGAGDLVVGAGQLASNLADPVIPGAADRFSNYMQSREQDYRRRVAALGGNADSLDIGRATGEVASGLGGMGAVRAAPTLLARMVQGAGIGGTSAAVAPINPAAGTGQPRADYGTEKATQIGLGTGAGALAVPAVEGLIRGAGATANYIAAKARGLGNTVTGETATRNIEQTLQVELQRTGVDWSSLNRDVRDGLVNQVRSALRSGGQIDPEAVGRLADFQRIGVQSLQGQISRDPLQFAREQNYAKLELGRPIADRLNQQNQQFIGTVDRLRQDTGAKAQDAYGGGSRVLEALRHFDAPRKAAVDTAYTNARGQLGLDADVPMQPVAQKLGQLIEDFGDDKIPAAVTKRLNEFGLMGGKQTRVFNIREAEKLKTLIGNNIENPNTPSGVALSRLRQSIDEAVNAIGEGPGSQAAQAFQQARGLASRRFRTLENTPALKNALDADGVLAPEKFIDTYVTRGELQDVANLMRKLNPEARTEVRAAVLDWIKGRAVNGGADAAKFSQAGMNRALNTIGDRKLQMIFAGDKQALMDLQALRRASAYAQSAPVASGVNYSNTATTGADFLDQVTRLPVFNLLGRPGDMLRAHQVAKMTQPAVPVQPGAPALNLASLARGARGGGIGASGLIGLAAPQVTAEPGSLQELQQRYLLEHR